MRPRLFGLAYRMLGSRAEAEDVVQEAYIRWHQADEAVIRNSEAWLVTAATPPDRDVELASDLSIAFRAVPGSYQSPHAKVA